MFSYECFCCKINKYFQKRIYTYTFDTKILHRFPLLLQNLNTEWQMYGKMLYFCTLKIFNIKTEDSLSPKEHLLIHSDKEK